MNDQDLRHKRPDLREDPVTPVAWDADIKNYWMLRWDSQTLALLPYHRQIDENVHMLLGQQHLVWHPLLQRHFDVSEWFKDPDRRLRERVVINKILPWFVITHSRMTENPPILTFLPGADAEDADIADAHDRLFKHIWRQTSMPDRIAQLQAWKIVAGSAYALTYIDPSKGELIDEVASAVVPIVGPDGQVQDQVQLPQVPLQPNGQPAIVMTVNGPQQVGPIAKRRRGGLAVEVLSPLEVRSEWKPVPLYDKKWHILKRWMSAEDIYDRFKVEVTSRRDEGTETIARRVLLGNGMYQPVTEPGLATGHVGTAARDLHEVLFCWEAPLPWDARFAEGENGAGGRFTVIANNTQVIHDSARALAYPFTSPIHGFDFFRLPGRQWASSPQDGLNSPQRNLNKQRSHINMHAHLAADPKAVIDRESGIRKEQWTNEPGTAITARRRNGVPAVEWMQAPRLGEDVWRTAQQAWDDIDYLGMTLGTSGDPISPDQSGEAIRELRFNADRYLGGSLRGDVEEIGRWTKTWMVHGPLLYDREELVRVVGEDDAPLAIRVYPAMFNPNSVDIVPDAESMLPESRAERQKRARTWWAEGLFGDPTSFEARRKYWEVARFPSHARAAQPGGVDSVTARRENGQLVRGTPANEIPVLEWYDHLVHLYEHEQEMKSHRFLRYPPEVQQSFIFHRMQHLLMLQQQQMQQAPPPAAVPGGGGGGAPAPTPNSPAPATGSALPALAQPPRGMPANVRYPTAAAPAT